MGLERGGGVKCDGKGGFVVDLGGFLGTPVEGCVRVHENSHIEDYRRDFPDACKNKPTGSAPKVPWDWKKRSECKAYKAEEKCEQALTTNPRIDGGNRAFCKKVLDDTRDNTSKCP